MRSASFEPGVVDAWKRVLARRWKGGAATFVLVMALAAAVVFLPRPVRRAEATLRLGAPPPVGGGLSLGGATSPAGLFSLFQQMTGDPFANELELLTSRTVMEGVVTDNALNVALQAPRGIDRDSVLFSLSAARAARKATYQATWLPTGRVAVRRTAPADAAYGPFAPGRPAAFDGVVVSFRPWRPGMPRTVELRRTPFGEAVRRTTGRLVAERKRREANLVRIAYDDPDAGLALRVVESAGARYAALRSDIQRRESGVTTDSLRTVAERTAAELRAQEDALERFQREARIVAPQAQGEAFVKRASEVDASLAKARDELAGVSDVLARLAAAPDPASGWAGLVAHPTFLENKTLGDLLNTLVHLEQQRLDLGGRRTAEDRTVQSLDRQIAYLDGSLRALVRQYRDGVAGQVSLLAQERAGLDSVLTRAPADQIELARRQRTVRELGEVYLFTDQRLRQESLRDALSFASVQVVDPPEVLYKPVWPRKGLGLGAGLLLALTFATLAMALMERADRSVHSALDIQAAAGAPLLAAATPDGDGSLVLAPAEARLLLSRNGANGGTPRRLVLAPLPEAEADGATLARLLLVPAVELVPAGVPVGGGGGANGNGARTNGHRPGAVAPSPRTYAAAAAIAAEAHAGAEVLLVVRAGATARSELARAAALLREAGTDVQGVLAVCPDARALAALWS